MANTLVKNNTKVELPNMTSLEGMVGAIKARLQISADFAIHTYGAGNTLIPATTLADVPATAKIWLQQVQVPPTQRMHSAKSYGKT